MKYKLLFLLLAVFFALSSLCGCAGGEKIYTASFESYEFFGTYCCVKIFAKNPSQARKDEMDETLEEVKTLLEETDCALSASSEGSDIYRFNAASAGERIEISPLTFAALSESKRLFEASDGLFDPTAAASVDLWGFSARFYNGDETEMPYDREEGVLPEQRYVEAFAELIDFSAVEFGEDFLIKPSKTVSVDGTEFGVMLDLGAVGKGFAADRVRDLLLEKGEVYASINIGQSSLVFLDSPFEGGFSVRIRHPRNPSQSALILSGLENVSIGISGDYQRFFEADGKRYCHIIDTRTGVPVDSGVMSAVTLCDNGAAADALSTVFMTEKAAVADRLAERLQGESGLCGFAVLTSQGGKYLAAGNADFEVEGDFLRAEFSASDDGLKIVASNYAGLIAGLALLVAAVALVILLDVRNRRAKKAAQNAEGSATDEGGSVEGVKPSGVVFDGAADNKRVSRTDIIKAQRLFRKKDMIIFGALLLCIILLFGFVVFGAPRGALSAVEIYFDGEKIFSYDVQTGGFECKDGFHGLATEKIGDSLFVSVETEKGFNKIEIKSNGEAKVVESDCRGGQCESSAYAVKRSGDAVLCVPHALKILGVGENDRQGEETL